MRNDNRGLTLVELLIGIAITSAVLIGILALVSSGTKSFTENSKEVNIQTEAQSTMNSISDILIEATDVKFGTYGSASDKVLLITASDVVSESVGGVAATSTKDVAYIIINDISENKLYMDKKIVDPVGGTVFDVNDSTHVDAAVNSIVSISDADAKEQYLLARYINNFEVTLPDPTARNRVVKLKIDFKSGKNVYEVRNDVKLRNGKSSTTETPTPKPVTP